MIRVLYWLTALGYEGLSASGNTVINSGNKPFLNLEKKASFSRTSGMQVSPKKILIADLETLTRDDIQSCIGEAISVPAALVRLGFVGKYSPFAENRLPDRVHSSNTRLRTLDKVGVVTGKIDGTYLWSCRFSDVTLGDAVELLFNEKPSQEALTTTLILLKEYPAEIPPAGIYEDVYNWHNPDVREAVRMVNIRDKSTHREGAVLVKIDRTTPYGNPFHMASESERDTVCEKFEEYFWIKYANDPVFEKAVSELCELARRIDVDVACWCAPKRCHGETYKRIVYLYLKSLTKQEG